MEINVRGVELKGDDKSIRSLLEALGINANLYYSRSSNKDLIIGQMDTKHILNALIKKLREAEITVGWEGVDLWEMLRVYGNRIPEEILLEMSHNDVMEFLSFFVPEINDDEFNDLLDELRDRDF